MHPNQTALASPGDETPDLRQLHLQMVRLHRKLGQIEEELYSVMSSLEALLEERGTEREVATAHASAGLPPRVLRPLRPAPMPGPRPQAACVSIEREHAGHGQIRVDDGSWFELTPALTDLVAVLVEVGSSGVGDGWCAPAELARRLTKLRGKRVRKSALANLVYRVRRDLYTRGGVNPLLVQTSARYGFRFAMHTPAGQSRAGIAGPCDAA